LSDKSLYGRPKIGVGLFLIDDRDRFMLLLRQGSHGAGMWGLIGGHQEYGKSPQQTAVDEAYEETGVVLDPAEIALGPYTNDVFDGEDEGKHYVTLFVSARLPKGQTPVNREQEKCDAMDWFTFDALPDRLFLPVGNFVKQGVRPPFDLGSTRDAQADFPPLNVRNVRRRGTNRPRRRNPSP
jgi:8-oxo-dGTP diphosphatase